jgi:simple sugar transport system ATP-binding protein
MEFVHQRIVRERDQGSAVLLLSTELEEILGLADRILVMFRGKVIGELAAADATAEQVGLLMAGST